MFPHRHLSSSIRPCLRNVPRLLASSSAIQRRGLTSSLSLKHPDSPTSLAGPQPDTVDPDTVDEGLLDQFESGSATKPTSYREFMEKIAYQYQYAHPMSYIGHTVEFVFSDITCLSD